MVSGSSQFSALAAAPAFVVARPDAVQLTSPGALGFSQLSQGLKKERWIF